MSGQPPLGFIFDMDDLLIRSKAFWHAAITALIADHGFNEATAASLDYRGLSANDTAALIQRELKLSVDTQAFAAAFGLRLLDELKRLGVDAMPGAVDAIEWAGNQGTVAVASGSPIEVIRHVLDQLGVAGRVSVVVSSHQVARGKPEPDVFLEAARQLAIPPDHCTVFEDSLVGVKAAVAAGMRCVAVPSERTDEIAALTPLVFNSLAEVPGASALR